MPESKPNFRPDLSSAEWTRTPYVFDRVAPALSRLQMGGTMNYTPWTSRGSATTNRNKYDSHTRSHMGSASTTYVCSEKTSTKDMAQQDVVQSYATLMHAELAMAAAGKDEVNTAIENILATALLQDAIDITTSENLPGDIESYVFDLADKVPNAKIALVMSTRLFTRLKGVAAIQERMKNIGIAIGEGGDPRNVTAAQMAAVLGVDEVILGKTGSWGAGKAVLVALPTAEKQPNEEVQLARTVVYRYDATAGIPFECTSWFDNDTDTHCVKSKTYADVLVLNAALKVAFQIFEEDESESGSDSGSASA